MQPREGLEGQHVQREALREVAAEPFARRHPDRVSRHFLIAEARDGLGIDLDLAGGRVERVRIRVRAELGELGVGRCRRGNLDEALVPEGGKVRHLDPLRAAGAAPEAIEVREPGHLVALFGEGGAVAQRIGDVGQHVGIVARLAHRRDRLVHRPHEAVARGAGDVVALQRRGGRQHDVGMAGDGGPPRLLHHHRVGAVPAAQQAPEILVVMEGVSARPPDHAGVGQQQVAAIVLQDLARPFQQFGDAGDGDIGAAGIADRHAADARHLMPRRAHAVHRAVAEGDALARLADAAQHGRQRRQRPPGLLAILGALDRPGGGQHGGRAGGFQRQAPDGGGGDVGQRLGPFRRLGRAIGDAAHVIGEAVEAGGAAGEEIAILAPGLQDHMGHRQHHRRIAVRADRHPFGAHERRRVAAEGRDVDEADPRLGGGLHQRHIFMPARAARGHQPVLQRQPAEAQHQPRILPDRDPVGDRALDHLIGAEDVGHQRHARAVGIIRHLRGEAAAEAEEAVQLRARMVVAPGRGPAIGSAEDRGMAVFGADARGFLRHQPDRLVPGDGDEGIAPAFAAAPSPLQPAGPDIGPVDAGLAVDGIGHAVEQRAGEGIAREGTGGDQLAAFDHRLEGAPMGRMRLDLGHGVPLSAAIWPSGARAATTPAGLRPGHARHACAHAKGG